MPILPQLPGTPASIGQLVGGPDSHFFWVKERIISMNTSRTVVGIVDALDWPELQIFPNTFYMVLGDTTSGRFGTKAVLGLSTVVQWCWFIPGDDLSTNQRGRNRGNRYRIEWQQMMAEIQYGLFPYYCPKQMWSAQDINGQIQTAASPVDPPEQIWWSFPRFTRGQKMDQKKAGGLYNIAQVGVSQFGDLIQA